MRIGNLQSVPWYLRLTIMVAIAGILYAGFYYLVTSGTRKETTALNNEIAILLPKNAQAQIASQRLNEFRAIYKARQEEYDELKALLPEQREITMVLQGLQDRARITGITFRKFLPKEEVQQENYSGKKIEVGVSSSFASLRAFFDQVAHYQRIVSITNFEVKQLDKQSSNRTVEARFDLTAFYVSAESLQKPTPRPAGAGGPAPVAPPK
ncbi:MAG: type 4a pilus biogenesis protein PilO [Acidobacteriota bacterium]